MITKFKIYLLESLKSNPISIDNKTFYIESELKDDVLNVNLLLNDMEYIKLSVNIPDSKNINKDEFFINPKVDKKIIDELIKQGYIQKLNKKSIAGENETQLYALI